MLSKKKQILYSALVMLAIIIIFGLIKFFQISKAIANSKNFAPPPEAVTTMIVSEEIWPNIRAAVGSVVATQGAILSAQNAGEVSKINFESGEFVESGRVLVELDTKVEQANLSAAIALQEQFKKSYERAKKLRSENAISISELEQAEAAFREASASVESLKSIVSRMKIISPFSGQAGIRKVNVGEYLNVGQAVVPVYALDPLYVNFDLPENFVQLVQKGQKVVANIEALAGMSFEGTITSVDPQVSSLTRNVSLQATIRNIDNKLKPGMFANIDVYLGGDQKFISVPTSAVNYAPYGDSVYVVEDGKDPNGTPIKTIRQQVIKLGSKRGNKVSVLHGLKSGDEVVTSGTFKLRPGAAISVNNSFAPENSSNPNVSDM